MIDNDLIIKCQSCRAINKVKFTKIFAKTPKCLKCSEELNISEFVAKFDVVDKLESILQNDLASILLTNQKEEVFYKMLDKTSKIKLKKEKLFLKELPITIVVTGEFNSGKSSVINSLIGEPLIPTGVEPMTLAPSIFRYNDELRISIETNNGKNIEISKEEFSEIKHTSKSSKIDFKNIKMIHFEYNYPKLAQIHIIDTPGFNTSTQKDDDEKTMEIIKNYADVVLWVFNANHGTSKDSEKTLLNSIRSLFLQKEKSVKTKNDFKNLSENINVPIIGLLNQIDVKGEPDSIQVNKILEDCKKVTSIEKIIPYSAKKTLESRENSLDKNLLDLINKDILTSLNENFSVSVKSDRIGNKTIQILKEDNSRIFESRVKNNKVWEEQVSVLEDNLNIVREKARENLVFSFFEDSDKIKEEIKKSILDVINKIENEKNIIIKAIDHQTLEIEGLIKILENKINNYKNEIKYRLEKNIPQFLFYFEVIKGIFWDSKRIRVNGNLQNSNADNQWRGIYEIIIDLFKINEFIDKEEIIFENTFDNLSNKINNLSNFKIFEEILRDSKANYLFYLRNTIEYLVYSNILMMRNSIIYNTLIVCDRDKEFDLNVNHSDTTLSKAFFDEIFGLSNFDIIFVYLKLFLETSYEEISEKSIRIKNFIKEDNLLETSLKEIINNIDKLD